MSAPEISFGGRREVAELTSQYGRVSMISSGSMPAKGLPTRLRTLSIPESTACCCVSTGHGVARA
eukprot:384111-Rhodomonas_salina.5